MNITTLIYISLGMKIQPFVSVKGFRLLGASQHKLLCHLPAFCPPKSQIPSETKVLILRIHSSPPRKPTLPYLNPI